MVQNKMIWQGNTMSGVLQSMIEQNCKLHKKLLLVVHMIGKVWALVSALGVEEVLYAWFIKDCQRYTPISRDILCEKASFFTRKSWTKMTFKPVMGYLTNSRSILGSICCPRPDSFLITWTTDSSFLWSFQFCLSIYCSTPDVVFPCLWHT